MVKSEIHVFDSFIARIVTRSVCKSRLTKDSYLTISRDYVGGKPVHCVDVVYESDPIFRDVDCLLENRNKQVIEQLAKKVARKHHLTVIHAN